MNCKYCNNKIENNSNCNVCNYPSNGTEKEKASFIAKQIMAESDVKDSIQKLNYARVLLFILGGFHFIIPILMSVSIVNSFVIYLNISIGILFCGFGALSFRYPKLGFGLPLAIILIYYTLLILFVPYAFFTGIVWKVIILAGLSFGYYRVYSANKTLKENPYLAEKLGLNRIGKSKPNLDF
jgi:hypothetical protein